MLTVDWLFLDMNSYFASVEQQARPALRGRPVAVVPVMTDRTCCIAASYEARHYGIRTGTNVGEARRRCPRLRLVEARHELYIRTHQKIIEAVETVLPVERVCSIDEMVCRISPQHRSLGEAIALAGRVKRAISQHVGPFLRCSVGLATNRFLAKVASNMQKPDGLTYLTRQDLPHKLYQLSLSDLPGIGRAMLGRLNRRGVLSVRQLCSLSREHMIESWESVVGEHWWHWLRGDECAQAPTRRRSVSHSHVLAPQFRNDQGAYSVLVRLIHKAAARMRRLDFSTRRMSVGLSYTRGQPKWKAKIYLGWCRDTQTMLRAFEAAWSHRPMDGVPLKVSVVLWDLAAGANLPLPLFAEERRNLHVARAMDAINERLGPNSVYFASMHKARGQAPMRIAFTHIPDVMAESERNNPQFTTQSLRRRRRGAAGARRRNVNNQLMPPGNC
jgi:DNA polymerase IV